MSTSTYHLNQGTEMHRRWLDEVARRFSGFRPRYENELYADSRSGRVYIGSEYIARMSSRSGGPLDASEWREAPIVDALGIEWPLTPACVQTLTCSIGPPHRGIPSKPHHGPGCYLGLDDASADAVAQHAGLDRHGPRTTALFLTQREAGLLYGMLTQRLYLRGNEDPDRDEVITTRAKVYELTSAAAEGKLAAQTLGGEVLS
jgi:hypothetical protein